MACSFHRRHIQEWKPAQSSCNRVLLDCPAHQPAIREHCSNTAGQETHSCSSHSSSPLTSSPASHSLEALADFGASQVGKIFYLPFDTRAIHRAKLIKGFRHWTLGMDVSLKNLHRAKHLEISFHNMQHPATKSRVKRRMQTQKNFSAAVLEVTIQKKDSWQ